MSILLFFVVLFVLVLVHELGHFVVAKRTGMRVDEFGIGFPPKVVSTKRGETEYTLNLLPIGGFVRIFGEDLNQRDKGVDSDRAFSAKSKWAQAAVLVAGVVMNIIFAWLLFVAVLLIGVPSAVDEEAATDSAQLVIAEVLPDSPAAIAGLPVGARVTELRAGEEVLDAPTPSSVTAFTTNHVNEAITVAYEVNDEHASVVITPSTGVIEGEASQPAIGVALSLIETVQYSFIEAVMRATETTASALVAITVGITNLIMDAVTFTADFSGVAGPVGIVGMVGDAADYGITSLLMFTAIISLNLAVINLLPFPALDGGRLLFVAIEAVIRRPINPVWAARANMIGFGLLMLLMVAVTYNDILRLT